MLVAEEAVEIRVLRRQGKSIREIARTLEVSRNMNWSKSMFHQLLGDTHHLRIPLHG